jgi:hypothetical protein
MAYRLQSNRSSPGVGTNQAASQRRDRSRLAHRVQGGAPSARQKETLRKARRRVRYRVVQL